MNKVHVVAAVIRKDLKFLLGKRALHKKSAPGYWCPISGQIEPGESEEAAIVRECFEEVGLTVRPVRKVTEFEIDGGKSQLHWWLVQTIDGEPYLKNDEHTELRWFNIQEMKLTPDFFEEDVKVYVQVLAMNW